MATKADDRPADETPQQERAREKDRRAGVTVRRYVPRCPVTGCEHNATAKEREGKVRLRLRPEQAQRAIFDHLREKHAAVIVEEVKVFRERQVVREEIL